MAEKEGTQVSADSAYTVVARRYRPKSFSELVGQENVSQALATAIRTGRIGHAYLFTGARGVGKTSTARIFAKALNAGTGPSADPDLESDIALAIDAGEDLDVLEIDGASNRGIEEIRQLRANVHVRPSRSRFKIYIIDEVHMLTTQAFNALLKTLEEPPEHVKFIFCTTDPEKIPITVLSRCQRFDFPPVKKEAIQDRLRFICQQEGFPADEAALALIARRASGSMRDSQSLLEQILSFSEGKISVESVQELLGSADDSSLSEMVEHFIAHDAVAVLQAVESSASRGVEPGQFAEQLLGYFRDLLTRCVGAPADLLRHVHSVAPEQLSDQAARWGMQSLIGAMQILDESLVRMRHSMHGRTLLEMTLVQITQLHRLEDIFGISSGLTASAATPQTRVVDRSVAGEIKAATVAESESPATNPPVLPQKKNIEAVVSVAAKPNLPLAPSSEAHDLSGSAAVATKAVATKDAVPVLAVDTENAKAVWDLVVGQLQGLLADFAALSIDAVWVDRQQISVCFEKRNQHAIDHLQRPDRKDIVEKELQNAAGRSVKLIFQSVPDRGASPADAKPASDVNSLTHRNQRIRQVAEHPLVKALVDTLGGQLLRVDPPAAPRSHLDRKG